jgi:predicted MPP superfamily phosphohydrolase
MKLFKLSYLELIHLIFEATIIFGLLVSFLVIIREIRILFFIKDLNLVDLFLLFFFTILFLTLIYGSYILPKRMKVEKYEISFNRKNLPIKAAFFSDLHLGPYKKRKYLEKIIQKINAFQPDVVFLGGDLISMKGKALKELDPLKKIQARLGAWAVLGNHEFDLPFYTHEPDFKAAQIFKEKLKELGVNILDNRVEHFQNLFNLVGVNDLWVQKKKDLFSFLEKLKTKLDFKYPTFLLSHNPDIMYYLKKTQLDKKIDVVLSGHTHGGQIRLPIIGPLWTVPSITNYQQNFYQQKKTQLYVTYGAGESGPRARLFSRPEIVFFEINL